MKDNSSNSWMWTEKNTLICWKSVCEFWSRYSSDLRPVGVEGLGKDTALLLIFFYQHIEFINKVLFKCVLSSFSLFSSIHFGHSVLFDSLRPHDLQHPWLSCSSPVPRAYPNSCPLSWWCHITICRLFLLPSIFPSIRVFSNEPVLCIRWP